MFFGVILPVWRPCPNCVIILTHCIIHPFHFHVYGSPKLPFMIVTVNKTLQMRTTRESVEKPGNLIITLLDVKRMTLIMKYNFQNFQLSPISRIHCQRCIIMLVRAQFTVFWCQCHGNMIDSGLRTRKEG